MRNPRFLDGRLHTGLIAQDYPTAFNPSHAVHYRARCWLRAWPPTPAGAT